VFYQPCPAEDYEWINCRNPKDYDVFWGFDGSSRVQNWQPIKVRFISADRDHVAKQSDFPWLGSHALVMSRTAVDALRSLVDRNGEMLPLATENGRELFVLNVTRILAALDEERSTILRVPGSERIMEVSVPVFRESVVSGVDVFRLPFRTSPTYVGEGFVSACRDLKLKGLEFVRGSISR